ncbi:DUF3830 family protein [Jiella sp. MQZ9-1]|uniref:DUF3830 family protein n=1 Tax=Jiella flava TaxID=2816857 RepID=A0A939FZR6_9HYPH|nr:DUF3830 family protein [Jiella flava]MCD2471765.1 DUF3830 family protein [Jiella flava]
MTDSDKPDSWYWEQRWTSFRRGTKKLKLEWNGGEATALIYDAGVPNTSAAILAALPLIVPVVHVAWSGDMLMSTRDYDLPSRDLENEVRLVRPGDLTWDPKFGELAFTYGTAECRLPSGPNTLVVYGSIETAFVDAFAEFGRRRRFEGVGEIKISAL